MVGASQQLLHSVVVKFLAIAQGYRSALIACVMGEIFSTQGEPFLSIS